MKTDYRDVWGISGRTAAILFSVPFIGLALTGAAFFLSKSTWRWIEDEDGPIEWFQFAGLIVGSFFSLAIAYHLVLKHQRLAAVLFSGLGLGLFFIGGEEIAWGQRLVQFETPESLAEVNTKGELSVHNVGTVSELFNLGKFVAGLYGFVGCWVVAWLSKRRDVQLLELFVPPWFLTSAFFVILMQRVLRWTVLQGHVPRGYGEFDETCFVFGMTAFVLLVWRRVKRAESAIEAGQLPSVAVASSTA